ncbi:MAG: hypothetical protein IPO31_24785 [Candidatus Obscuribacter sp.]|nr:hypothetical protein [Candidatus Obscuribacter sp.]
MAKTARLILSPERATRLVFIEVKTRRIDRPTSACEHTDNWLSTYARGKISPLLLLIWRQKSETVIK